MQNTHNNRSLNYEDNEIDIRELFRVILKGKWIIISMTSFFSIAAVIFSLSLPNIYQSSGLVNTIEQRDEMLGALSSYSNLAGIAGINLPQSGGSNATKAKRKLTSLSFFENNVLPYIYLPELMAVKYWDSNNNSIVFDEEIYNVRTNTWIRNFSYPQKKIPSSQESLNVFLVDHLSISEDNKTGFITISIRHQSPYIAKEWVELLVSQINIYYRQVDKETAIKKANYLNTQIIKTNLSEVKEMLAELLQAETKVLTLIEANKDYVYEYIDPPAVMEIKSEPRRALICIFGALLGGVLSIFIVLLRYLLFKEKNS